ncbi:MAG: hypothetical protein PUA83_03190 [Clostridiales bacterium]|nr:hypothetical protein [Clostridiales bacterium]
MGTKILGMPANICLGLGFLIWPIALIAVLVEKRTLLRGDRVILWSAVMSAGLCYAVDSVTGMLCWIPVVRWVLIAAACVISITVTVFTIIAAVKCFTKNYGDAKIPFITEIVEKRVH